MGRRGRDGPDLWLGAVLEFLLVLSFFKKRKVQDKVGGGLKGKAIWTPEVADAIHNSQNDYANAITRDMNVRFSNDLLTNDLMTYLITMLPL